MDSRVDAVDVHYDYEHLNSAKPKFALARPREAL
jgi:hypothetical protein